MLLRVCVFFLIVDFTLELNSGRIGSGRVGSGRIGSGRVGSGRDGSDRVGSGRVGSGKEVIKHNGWVGSCGYQSNTLEK